MCAGKRRGGGVGFYTDAVDGLEVKEADIRASALDCARNKLRRQPGSAPKEESARPGFAPARPMQLVFVAIVVIAVIMIMIMIAAQARAVSRLCVCSLSACVLCLLCLLCLLLCLLWAHNSRPSRDLGLGSVFNPTHSAQLSTLTPRAHPCCSDWTCGIHLCDATSFVFATRREL